LCVAPLLACLQVLFHYVADLPETPSDCFELRGITHSRPGLDLMLCVTSAGSLAVQYSKELFDNGTIQRMAATYTQLLRQMSLDAQQPLESLPMLSALDRHLLSRFVCPNPRPDYLAEPLMHQAFLATAAERPDHPCLVYDGEMLTYRQASQRADRLARHLVSLGVRTNTVVGVFVSRSFELPISLLAIMMVSCPAACSSRHVLMQF
jgi:non-ribosomal peptide synthetase component F